jgi:hypothetical protein
MKRDELELLALADHRVALTDMFLQKQGEVIDALSRLGNDTTDAYCLMIEFEQMRARLLADRAQLRRDLEQEFDSPVATSLDDGNIAEAEQIAR